MKIMVMLLAMSSLAAAQARDNPGCEKQTAQQCLNLAFEAMGGKQRLQQVQKVRLQSIGHTLLMEQSYRQEPFIASYERATTTLDFGAQRAASETKLTWPESDNNQSESTTMVVTGPEGGVRRGKEADGPCSLADIEQAQYSLALGPVRVLLTAEAAADLHFEHSEIVRSTPHAVLAFKWQGIPVKLMLNRFNHLPDAVEMTREFHDFWFFWGDVKQRVYLDNWKLADGIVFPTNWVEERNGALWRSKQVLKIEINPAVDETLFRMDAAVASKSGDSPGWKRPFRADKSTSLALGIDFFPGAWNSTVVKQTDGIVIVEAPISERYMQGVFEEARKRYPGLPIKAVLSTSDSWPHTGGVRFAVAQRLPVYILDLNHPLLDRLMRVPHSLDPDALESSKQGNPPMWKIVSARQGLGTGANRIELYPLRGASTERQYMVYFPEHQLLYASDTLVINEDGTLYDPELMNEVVQAVEREGLKVDKVFAMHQGLTEWSRVLELLGKSKHS